VAIEHIPINSLSRHFTPLSEALSDAAKKIIDSGYFVLGPSVAKFEHDFASYCGTTHCIGVANGTDALELALKGLGIKPGDNVAVCANAAMYSTSAVIACEAIPQFIDVDPLTATMSTTALKQLLENSDKKIAAIVVTHLYGRLAEIASVCLLASQHGIKVLEDCAQAHGARDASGKLAGSFGDAASFSFYPTKNLGAIGDGGAVITSDNDVAVRVKMLRQYGWASKYQNALSGGRNSRLDEIQAAFLSVLLPYLDAWNSRRRHIANRYSTEIQHADIQTPAVSGEDYVAHLYVINSARRDALRQHLEKNAIGTDIHYPTADHRQPLFENRYADIHLSHTESLCKTSLTLPCFPELTDQEVQRVIDTCNDFS
jgi:dTDP-4-amino-4,6-dideoxygalactose transaminase